MITSTSKNLLSELGLKKDEIEVFLLLSKSGPTTVLDISKQININRTRVHVLVDQLINLGLLSEIPYGKKRKIIAMPPEAIDQIIKKQEIEIQRKKEVASRAIEAIYHDFSHIKEDSITNTKYYNTIESINWLYDKILDSREVRTCVNSTEIMKVFPGNWKRFLGAVQKGVKLWDLHVYDSKIDTQFENISEMYPNFMIKRLPPSVTFESMDYLLYEDKITIIYGFPRPHAIEIENAAFNKMSTVLFDFLWSICERIYT